MIHQPLGGATGQATDIHIATREILNVKQRMTGASVGLTGKDFETISNDIDRDYFMTAAEAKEYGIVDEILRLE